MSRDAFNALSALVQSHRARERADRVVKAALSNRERQRDEEIEQRAAAAVPAATPTESAEPLPV